MANVEAMFVSLRTRRNIHGEVLISSFTVVTLGCTDVTEHKISSLILNFDYLELVLV